MRKIISLSALFLMMVSAFSQSKPDETILTIGQFKFTEGEFWHIYSKNKDLSSYKETPEQFAERFINYKLKVVAAIDQKMDTLPAFVSEYGKYADELAAGYLIDSAAVESAARSAYTNMTKLVNASHILVALSRSATPTPADTLAAWQKITEIRNRVLAGEDFNEIAATQSEDPSARQNQGRLGYFTAFQMVYPFEKAAFSTPVGEVSEIVRSQFGYHILKVHDVRPNTGKIRVAHIMKIFPRDVTPQIEEAMKVSIDSIYAAFKSGADFAELAQKHSDDRGSAARSGEMQPFNYGQIPVFSDAAFELVNDGDVSEPVKSPFGWHIIKRLELTPVEDYQTAHPSISSMLARDERGQAGNVAFVEARKKSPLYRLNGEVFSTLSAPLNSEIKNKDDYFGKITATTQILFEYDDAKVTVSDFVEYLKNDASFLVQEGTVALQKALDKKVSETVMEVERKKLPERNPAYRYLANEYHDGLLIFELSNQEIWAKVGTDSVALYEHYLNYSPEFVEYSQLTGTQCYVNNEKLIAKISKAVAKNPSANISDIVMKYAKKPADSKCITGTHAFAKSVADNPVKAELLPDDNELKNATGVVFWQGNIEKGAVIPYENCKGDVMNSYQTLLETEWIKSLRNKYNPVFNSKLLKKKRK
ncbi:MAG: peptidylprolyl isomerase [Cytophagaceae bacterium]|nr:peptidylprolyl isomerase [Cytophagaceae bacterium]